MGEDLSLFLADVVVCAVLVGVLLVWHPSVDL